MGFSGRYVVGAIQTPVYSTEYNGTVYTENKELEVAVYNIDYYFKQSKHIYHAFGLYMFLPLDLSLYYSNLAYFMDKNIRIATTIYSNPRFTTQKGVDVLSKKETLMLAQKEERANGLYTDVTLWGYHLGYLRDIDIFELLFGYEFSTTVGDFTFKLRYKDVLNVTSYDAISIYNYTPGAMFSLYSENVLNSLQDHRFLLRISLGKTDDGAFHLGSSYLSKRDLFGYFVGYVLHYKSKEGSLYAKAGYSKNYIEDLEYLPIFNENLFSFRANVFLNFEELSRLK